MLRELVEQHGTKAWAKIASIMRTKGSKQCRWVALFGAAGGGAVFGLQGVALVWLQAAVGFPHPCACRALASRGCKPQHLAPRIRTTSPASCPQQRLPSSAGAQALRCCGGTSLLCSRLRGWSAGWSL